jgi:hypothetical protein
MSRCIIGPMEDNSEGEDIQNGNYRKWKFRRSS